jgi:hypothetical protein
MRKFEANPYSFQEIFVIKLMNQEIKVSNLQVHSASQLWAAAIVFKIYTTSKNQHYLQM